MIDRGYEETTVADIAAAAGLTKRTFFRYFADKREVLFSGSEELVHLWLEAVAAAPADAEPLAAATAGFDPVAEMFVERHEFAQMRARIIDSNPELQERELIKLQNLAGSIKSALIDRGVPQTPRSSPLRRASPSSTSRSPDGSAGRPGSLPATDGRVAGGAARGDDRVNG